MKYRKIPIEVNIRRMTLTFSVNVMQLELYPMNYLTSLFSLIFVPNSAKRVFSHDFLRSSRTFTEKRLVSWLLGFNAGLEQRSYRATEKPFVFLFFFIYLFCL